MTDSPRESFEKTPYQRAKEKFGGAFHPTEYILKLLERVEKLEEAVLVFLKRDKGKEEIKPAEEPKKKMSVTERMALARAARKSNKEAVTV